MRAKGMNEKEREAEKLEEGGVRLPGGCMTHSPAAGSCVTGAVLEVEIVERSVHLIMACQFIRTVLIHTHTHIISEQMWRLTEKGQTCFFAHTHK